MTVSFSRIAFDSVAAPYVPIINEGIDAGGHLIVWETPAWHEKIYDGEIGRYEDARSFKPTFF